jgi:uncharacterized protein
MKKYLIITIAILALFPAVFLLVKNLKTETQSFVLHDKNKDAEMFSAHLEAPPKDFSPGYDAVSIPAFSKKGILGSDFKLEKVIDDNEVYTRYAISYLSGKLNISGIMNIPKGTGPWPVIFLNHGYIDPGIYTSGRGLKREQDYLARRGYAVVHPDYRGHATSDKETGPDIPDFRLGYSEDVLGAIDAIKKAGLPNIDASRIGMLGHSMGGGIAQIIAVSKPDAVRAIVLFAPVSSDERDNYDRWMRDDFERFPVITERFGTPESNPRFWKEISPVNFFDRVRVPIQIHQGLKDGTCDPVWSKKTEEFLKTAGKDAKLFTYPLEDHEFIVVWPKVMQRTLEFFDREMKWMGG